MSSLPQSFISKMIGQTHLVLLLFLLLRLLLGSSLAAENVTEEEDSCRPMNCGYGPNITYPFWIPNKQLSICGLPDFQIICNNSSPVLHIENRQYNVTDIFYERTTMLVYDLGLGNTSICNLSAKNLTIDWKPFTLIPDDKTLNLSLFVNCTKDVNVFGYSQTDCPGMKLYYRYGTIPEEERSVLNKSCNFSVEVPVVGSSNAVDASGSLQMWKFGVLLSWNETYCNICKGSGGICMNRNETFACSCKHKIRSRDCPNSSGAKLTLKMKLVISACSLLTGFVLASLIFFACKKRRREKQGSSSMTKALRSISSMDDTRANDDLNNAHIFSYRELHEATDGFADFNQLGDGGFGVVYKGKLRDGRVVAVKRLYGTNHHKTIDQFMNEVSILNLLRHRNLVTLYGCTSQHSRELLLVYEYVSNGTVADHLHGSRAGERALTWPIRLNIAIETAGALKYLHAIDPQIIHRDVKTTNILLDDDFRVKVGDFGMSRLYPAGAPHVSTVPQGTPGYVDPEYHKCYKLTDKSDVYSFGVVLVELVSSMPAVDFGRNQHEINLASLAVHKIQQGLLHEIVDHGIGFDDDAEVRRMIESVAELAFRCLQAEKEMRPSMDEALKLLEEIADADCHDDDEKKKKKTTKMENHDDGRRLLEESGQVSPKSVAEIWTSRLTTPNTSNNTP